MNLTNGEKLILMMLSDLGKKLEVKGEIDPKFVSSAIYSDNLWGLEWEYGSLLSADNREENPEEVTLVVDTLDMWDFIESSYSQFSQEEKDKLEQELGYLGKEPKFIGFDGNNETEYLSIARFLINDLNRFTNYKDRELNSHMPKVEKYKQMLSIFKPVRTTMTDHPFKMSYEQLKEVLSAK